MTAVVLLGFLLLGVAAFDDGAATEALERLRGQPALVELPGLEDLGTPLDPIPDGWRYLQATSETVTFLEKKLAVPRIPCLVYVDRFGNPLHWDTSAGYRRRLATGLSEFKKRRRELERRLARLWRQAVELREDARAAAELEILLRLRATNARGYPEIASATRRIGEIERQRAAEFLEILAGEGWRPADDIEDALRELQQRSRGLAIARRILRERERIKRGIVVAPGSPGGARR